MAGLSGLNFVDGAMRGAQFVAGMQDRQQRAGLLQAREDRMKESHGKEMEVRDMQIKKAGMDMEEEAKKRIARTMRAAEKNGVPLSQIPMSDDDKAFFEKFGPTAAPQYFMSDGALKATGTLNKVMSGELNVNHPETHRALEVFAPEIQSGTKADGTVSVNGIYPSRDGKGIHIGLHLKRKDGTEDPNAVVTVGRTSDPKDPVRTIELGSVLGRGAAMEEYQRIASDQKLAKVFMDTYAPEDALQNLKALKYKADIAKSLRGDPVTYQADSEGNLMQLPSRSGGAVATPVLDSKGNPVKALKYKADIAKSLRGDPVTYQADSEGNLMQLPSRSGGAVATPVLDSKGNPVKAPQKTGAGTQATQRQKDFEFAVSKLGMDQEAALEWSSSDKTPTERAEAYANRMVQAETVGGNFPEGYKPNEAWKAHREAFMNEYGNFGKGDKQPKPSAQPKQNQSIKQAPQGAIEALRNNPELKDQFQAKYGYLPE